MRRAVVGFAITFLMEGLAFSQGVHIMEQAIINPTAPKMAQDGGGNTNTMVFSLTWDGSS